MTVISDRYLSLAGALAPLAIAMAALFALAAFSAACGSDDAKGAGTLTEVSVSPEAGYPDVELTVSLQIEPEDGADADDYSWRVDFNDGNSRSGQGASGQAVHAYDDVGEYSILVEALLDGAVVDSARLDFPVYDPVDLMVDSVLAQPANVRVDENVTISFDVHNQTASPILTPFEVRAYLAPDNQTTRDNFADRVADGDLVPVGDQTLALDDDGISLRAGQRRNVSINNTVPDVPTGHYHGVVVIDPDHHLSDRTPNNTVASSTSTIHVENLDQGLPNLSVQALEVSPERAFPELNHFTRAFTLINLGGEDIFNVVHRTYVQVGSPQRGEDAVLVHESDPINLFSQGQQQIGPESFVLTEPIIPTDGEKEVYVIVEAFSEDGDVEEITQTNNIAASNPPITVSDEPVDGPDIAVLDFSIAPDSTFLGGSLEMNATIANEGTQDVGSFFCGIYMGAEPNINPSGDPQVSTVAVTSLDAGEERYFDRELSISAVHNPGVYYFYIVCDPMGAINQPFRGNSQAIQFDPITITDEADIDLYVAEVEVPETADDGDLITVTTTFCVMGSNPTGTTTAALFTSPGSNVDFDAEPLTTFSVPNINPSECLEVDVEIEAQCQDFDDQLSIGVLADAEESLPEDNTSNNYGTADDPVQLDGLYCECIEDDFGPNQSPFAATPMDSGSYEASLCTASECDFYSVELDAGDSLLVTTEHDSSRGALETTLYAPGGYQQLDKDTSADVQKVGVFLASTDGLNYVIEVCGQTNDVRNYYDLDIEVIAQPSDVDVLPRNISIPPNDTFSVGSVIDVDFRIYNLGEQLTGEFDVDLVLTSARELGNADDITLATHTIDSISAGSHRDVTLEAPLSTLVADDDYYIAVVLDPAQVLNETNRDNNVGFTPTITVETSCYDPFTPNDSFSTAASIGEGTYSNLVACSGSSDYYEICAPNGTSLNASVTFDSTQGDIDAILYNQTLESVDSSAQSGVDLEQVGVDYVDGDQCFYLRVVLVSLDADAENNYSLNININEVDPDLQCDPTFEPNDHFGTATSLWAALDYDSTIDRCPKDDVDFYYVNLSPQSTVDFSAGLEPANQSGTLRLQLYGPNLVPIETVETAPGIPTAEINDFQASTTGTYYLQVSVSGNEHRVHYSLDASGLPGIDLAVVDLGIGPGTYVPGDTVRYGFDLANYGGNDVASVDYKVYLSSSSSLDPENDQVLGQFTVDDVDADSSIEIDGQLNLPSNISAGTHYFHVFVDPDDDLNDVNRNNNRAYVTVPVVADDDGDDNGDT